MSNEMKMLYDPWGNEIKNKFVDLNGNPIKRTPLSWTYSYDEFVIWKDENFKKEECSAVYSDRLLQWSHEKFDKCCQEIFKNKGQYFSERDPKDIEKFLSLYFEKEIKLMAITQGCNTCTGYPYWVFFYKEIN